MAFVTFNATDILTFNSLTSQYETATNQTDISIKKSSIDFVEYNTNIGAAKVFTSNESGLGTNTFFILDSSPALESLKTDIGFVYIDGINIYQFTNVAAGVPQKGYSILLNRQRIVSTQKIETVAVNGIPLYMLTYEKLDATGRIYVTEGIIADITNQDVPVAPVKSTEFIYINELSQCWDITVVNHTTGVSNTIHTPLYYNDYFIEQRYHITAEGGFLLVFNNNGYTRTFIYFIDSEGNLVDQIDGFGPGYQWGQIDNAMVYGADNDNGLSVLKIFDGKNIRTYEFPYLAYFGLSPFSEGDMSKNQYVPFSVDNFDLEESYLYISTPGGGLIELDTWYDGNESFSTVHPSSDKIFRMTWDGLNGKYKTLEAYSEGGILINSIELSGYNVTDYSDRVYYGTNGDFFLYLYNWEDNSVPRVFVNYNSSTNKFSLTVDENGNNGWLNAYYTEYNPWNATSWLNNGVVIVTSTGNVNQPIGGFFEYEDGAVVYWINSNSDGWNTWTPVPEGDAVQLSYGNGVYGRYPMFIVDEGNGDPLSAAILQDNGTVSAISTGIIIDDVSGVETWAAGETTMSRIINQSGSAYWGVYNEQIPLVSAETTDDHSVWIDGDVILVLDNINYNDSWAFTATAGEAISLPVTNGNYQIQTDDRGAWVNPYGYVANGLIVIFDKDGSNNPTAFHVLNTGNTDFYTINNTWSDDNSWDFAIGNTQFTYWTYNITQDKHYSFVYDGKTGSLFSAVAVNNLSGSEMWWWGDRFNFEVGDGDYKVYYSHTVKGPVVTSFNEAAYSWNVAYNDSQWSND